MKKNFLLMVCVALSGCGTMSGWADQAGSYLPVLSDERCEHWQCFTDEGKAQSEYNKQMQQGGGQPPADPASVQQQQQPPAYNPPPEQNPYDNYRP